MNITSGIYKKVVQYLNNEITLSQFEDWFLPNLGQILSLPSCPTLDLAGEIELGLAEMSSGHRTETEFSTMLRNVIESNETFILHEPAKSKYFISTGTINTAPIIREETTPADTVDNLFRKVPA